MIEVVVLVLDVCVLMVFYREGPFAIYGSVKFLELRFEEELGLVLTFR